MGLFDKFKKKKDSSSEEINAAENKTEQQSEKTAPVAEETKTGEDAPRASLLERLSGGDAIFTDH